MNASAEHRMPEEAHGRTEPAPHHKVNYLGIFAILIALTVITVAVWFLHMTAIIALLIALLIASVKAAFVALYFMHLKFEGKLIYLIIGLPLILTVILILALLPDIVHGPAFNPEALMVGEALEPSR